MSRAFLVVGPQASGTRLMTDLLIRSGCYGDSGHEQRLDSRIPKKDLIVWRRSFPHDNKWPNLKEIIDNLDTLGYRSHVIIMSRDWNAVIKSQKKELYGSQWAPDSRTAVFNITEAYRKIFRDVSTINNLKFEIVNYESILMRPNKYINAFLLRLGLEEIEIPLIYDGNQRYYQLEEVCTQ